MNLFDLGSPTVQFFGGIVESCEDGGVGFLTALPTSCLENHRFQFGELHLGLPPDEVSLAEEISRPFALSEPSFGNLEVDLSVQLQPLEQCEAVVVHLLEFNSNPVASATFRLRQPCLGVVSFDLKLSERS